jgi:streptogramin lyase
MSNRICASIVAVTFGIGLLVSGGTAAAAVIYASGNNNVFLSGSVFRFDSVSGTGTKYSAGSEEFEGIDVGVDGNLYVTANDLGIGNRVVRINTTTGAGSTFVAANAGGLSLPHGLTFGPDGHLYVASQVSNGSGTTGILKFNGTTGASMGTFVAAGSGGLVSPFKPLFGADGRLYVSDFSGHAVRRYAASTGAFIDTFVPSGSGGLNSPTGIEFGPDGNLYVADTSSDDIRRYNGTTGSFISTFVPAGSGGLADPRDLAFGPDGILYVTSLSANPQILQ